MTGSWQKTRFEFIIPPALFLGLIGVAAGLVIYTAVNDLIDLLFFEGLGKNLSDLGKDLSDPLIIAFVGLGLINGIIFSLILGFMDSHRIIKMLTARLALFDILTTEKILLVQGRSSRRQRFTTRNPDGEQYEDFVFMLGERVSNSIRFTVFLDDEDRTIQFQSRSMLEELLGPDSRLYGEIGFHEFLGILFVGGVVGVTLGVLSWPLLLLLSPLHAFLAGGGITGVVGGVVLGILRYRRISGLWAIMEQRDQYIAAMHGDSQT